MTKVTEQGKGSGVWMVWDEAQAKRDGFAVTADIVKCSDSMMGRVRTFYRVDKSGRTVDTLIRTRIEAVKVAAKAIKSK